MAVDQLKANRLFEDPLTQSQQQQIDEIDEEKKIHSQFTYHIVIGNYNPLCKNLTS
jgi:hypothetical protein